MPLGWGYQNQVCTITLAKTKTRRELQMTPEEALGKLNDAAAGLQNPPRVYTLQLKGSPVRWFVDDNLHQVWTGETAQQACAAAQVDLSKELARKLVPFGFEACTFQEAPKNFTGDQRLCWDAHEDRGFRGLDFCSQDIKTAVWVRPKLIDAHQMASDIYNESPQSASWEPLRKAVLKVVAKMYGQGQKSC